MWWARTSASTSLSPENMRLSQEKALTCRAELQTITWWTSGSQGSTGERGSEKAAGQKPG